MSSNLMYNNYKNYIKALKYIIKHYTFYKYENK